MLHANKNVQKPQQNKAFRSRVAANRRVNKLRKALVADLGGDISAQRKLLVNLLVRDVVILEVLDAELIGFGRGIVNRRNRNAVRLLGERGTLADSVARRLSQLGLDRAQEDPLAAIRRLTANAAPSPAPQAQSEPDSGPDDDPDLDDLATLERLAREEQERTK